MSLDVGDGVWVGSHARHHDAVENSVELSVSTARVTSIDTTLDGRSGVVFVYGVPLRWEWLVRDVIWFATCLRFKKEFSFWIQMV